MARVVGLLADISQAVASVLPDLPFAVDTFTEMTAGKLQLITHAHKDHLLNIQRCPSRKAIICTCLTQKVCMPLAQLITIKYPELATMKLPFIRVSDGDDIELPGCSGWRVAVMDANHCPGAIMLLLYGPPGCTILHTGDCRMTGELVGAVRRELDRIGRRIDLLYLDCTFADKAMLLPSMQSSLDSIHQLFRQILRCGQIERIYLACEMLGTEEVLLYLHDRLGIPIYMEPPAPKASPPSLVTATFHSRELHAQRCKELRMLLPKGVLAAKGAGPESSPLHIIGGQAMKSFASSMQQVHGAGRYIILKPSVQRMLLDQTSLVNQAGLLASGRQLAAPQGVQQGDAPGLCHVMYSRHSSHQELAAAVEALRPRALLPFSGRAPPSLLDLAAEADPQAVIAAIVATVREGQAAVPTPAAPASATSAHNVAASIRHAMHSGSCHTASAANVELPGSCFNQKRTRTLPALDMEASNIDPAAKSGSTPSDHQLPNCPSSRALSQEVHQSGSNVTPRPAYYDATWAACEGSGWLTEAASDSKPHSRGDTSHAHPCTGQTTHASPARKRPTHTATTAVTCGMPLESGNGAAAAGHAMLALAAWERQHLLPCKPDATEAGHELVPPAADVKRTCCNEGPHAQVTGSSLVQKEQPVHAAHDMPEKHATMPTVGIAANAGFTSASGLVTDCCDHSLMQTETVSTIHYEQESMQDEDMQIGPAGTTATLALDKAMVQGLASEGSALAGLVPKETQTPPFSHPEACSDDVLPKASPQLCTHGPAPAGAAMAAQGCIHTEHTSVSLRLSTTRSPQAWASSAPCTESHACMLLSRPAPVDTCMAPCSAPPPCKGGSQLQGMSAGDHGASAALHAVSHGCDKLQIMGSARNDANLHANMHVPAGGDGHAQLHVPTFSQGCQRKAVSFAGTDADAHAQLHEHAPAAGTDAHAELHVPTFSQGCQRRATSFAGMNALAQVPVHVPAVSQDWRMQHCVSAALSGCSAVDRIGQLLAAYKGGGRK